MLESLWKVMQAISTLVVWAWLLALGLDYFQEWYTRAKWRRDQRRGKERSG